MTNTVYASPVPSSDPANVATSPADLGRPSWRTHPLVGDRAGFYAMTVQANWRLVFRFDGADVELVDYLDYH